MYSIKYAGCFICNLLMFRFLQESMGDGVLFVGELEDAEWMVLYLSGCKGKIRGTSSRLEVLNLPFIECRG